MDKKLSTDAGPGDLEARQPRQFRVEFDREDLAHDEILIQRVVETNSVAGAGRLRVLERTPRDRRASYSGTTDRLLRRNPGDEPRAT